MAVTLPEVGSSNWGPALNQAVLSIDSEINNRLSEIGIMDVIKKRLVLLEATDSTVPPGTAVGAIVFRKRT